MKDARSGKPIVNPTPRQMLHSDSKLLAQHRDLMQSPTLVMLIQMALEEYTRRLCNDQRQDVIPCASNFNRIVGAHEFVDVLRKMGESTDPQRPAAPEQLNHAV